MQTTTSKNVLLVNERQRGNPILKHMKNTKWEFSREVIPDYVMSSTCALFVSLKYHVMHNCYVDRRIKEIGQNFRLRVLITFVDDENNSQALCELNKLCFANDFTLILGWSDVECGRYIETLKEYEGKSSSTIQEKVETEFLPRASRMLTSVKSVNKTDVTTLLGVFGNISNICAASEAALVVCPGLGERKVKRLHSALNVSFVKKHKSAANVQTVITKVPAKVPSTAEKDIDEVD